MLDASGTINLPGRPDNNLPATSVSTSRSESRKDSQKLKSLPSRGRHNRSSSAAVQQPPSARGAPSFRARDGALSVYPIEHTRVISVAANGFVSHAITRLRVWHDSRCGVLSFDAMGRCQNDEPIAS